MVDLSFGFGERAHQRRFDGERVLHQSCDVRTVDFDYDLPGELIAQHPAAIRDASRMLVLHRGRREVEHSRFSRFPEFLRAGDLLVLNDSKVVPARLKGSNAATGGRFEVFLLVENTRNDWWALMRPGKRARAGTRIRIWDKTGGDSGVLCIVLESNEEGHRRVRFEGADDILKMIETLGEVPLPPYIERNSSDWAEEDRSRYQTVFARAPGSVAAPTAGLHFTENMISRLKHMGVRVCFVTLHVGLGTFAPVKAERIQSHIMHEERYEVSAAAAAEITRTKANGGRVVAVGTTSLRVLESVAREHEGTVPPCTGRTRLFVHPPGTFRVVDALLTNFHLPRSTLLMLVCAFAAPGSMDGRDWVLSAYAEAVREQYRFFSYGDAMLLL